MLAVDCFIVARCCSFAAAAPPRPTFTSERIGVTVVGSGPDVVLIPGLTSSPEVWRSTVAAVPGYRYHLVHVSGFAGRPAGANASGPVLEPVAEEIARYIREQRLEPARFGRPFAGRQLGDDGGRPQSGARRREVMVVDMMPFMAAMFGGPTRRPRVDPADGGADRASA